jgi:hypothetical protein
MREKVQLSTHHISARCGNLFLEEDFTNNILKEHLDTCLSRGWYNNPSLLKLLDQADEVWLASDWVEWTANLLPKSVNRIADKFDADVIVFGTKEFEINLDLSEFLSLDLDERQLHSVFVSDRIRTVNKKIKNELDETPFIDIVKLICPNSSCPTLTPDGALWTYDGAHLTESGAYHLGRLLNTEMFGPIK